MAAPTLQAEGATVAVTTGAPSVTIPTHQADDILVVQTAFWGPNTTGGGETPTPSGWTRGAFVQVRDGGDELDGEVAWFWKRAAGAGETVTLTRGTNWDTGNDTCYGARAYVVRGCVTTGDPWDEIDATVSQTAANGAFDAVTVSGSERTVIQFGASTDNAAFAMTSSGWTTGTEDDDATGTDCAFQTARKENVSADTGADTATVSAPAQGFYVFVGVSFKAGAGATDLGHAPLAAPLAVVAGTLGLSLDLAPAAVAAPLAQPASTFATSLGLAPDPVAAPLAVAAPSVALVADFGHAPIPASLTGPLDAFQSVLDLSPAPVEAPLAVVFQELDFAFQLGHAPLAVVLAHAAPSLGLGALELLPAPIASPLAVAAPAVELSLEVSVSPVAAPLAAPDPSVSLSLDLGHAAVGAPLALALPALELALALSPDPVPASLQAPSPALEPGAVDLAHAPVAAVLLVPESIVGAGFDFSHGPLVVQLAVALPSLATGAVELGHGPLAASLAEPAPQVGLGGLDLGHAPLAAPLVIVAPAVSLGALDLGHGPLALGAGVALPGLDLASDFGHGPLASVLVVPPPDFEFAGGAQDLGHAALAALLGVPAPSLSQGIPRLAVVDGVPIRDVMVGELVQYFLDEAQWAEDRANAIQVVTGWGVEAYRRGRVARASVFAVAARDLLYEARRDGLFDYGEWSLQLRALEEAITRRRRFS